MGDDGRKPFPSHRTLAQAAVLLAVCAAAWPLLSDGGLLNTRGGGDSPFLLQRLHQLVTALRDGHFPVRWMPDANYGSGYPFYNYYAPLSIYVAALFRLLGFGYVHAIQLAQGVGFLIAAWAVFRLATRWLANEWAGLLAAVAYSVAPFHMVNVYVRGDSLAEFWAMALYPVVLLAADELTAAEGNQVKNVIWLAASYGALILSHNISALIFTPFLLLYLLLRAGWSDRGIVHALRAPFLALALGLALSAWFWLPALAESGLVQLGPVTSGYFHFSNHFWGVDLVQPSLFFDYDVSGRNAFRMGLVQSMAIFLGLIALLRHALRPGGATGSRRVSTVPLIFTSGALFVATFMITPLSRPLWETLPLLPFTQFPWRFLSVQALAGAIFTGALALPPLRDAFRIGLTLIAAIVLVVTALGRLHTDHLTLAEDDVTAERLAQYEWFTGNIGTTVSAEYLPRSVQPRPYTSAWIEEGERDRVQVLAGEARARLTRRQTAAQMWTVTAGEQGATLVLPTVYWPGWSATVDGEETTGRPAPGSGLITVDVPAGEHTLTLTLRRTPVRLATELLSLAALALTGLLLVWGERKKGDERRRPSARFLSRDLWFFLVPTVLLALFLGLRPAPNAAPGSLNWDFAQMGYLHPAPGGVPFEKGFHLEEYAYEKEEVSPGETLTVRLKWSGATVGGPTAVLELVTPAVHRFEDAPPLVAHAQPLVGENVTFALDIPADAPAGLYTPRLTVEGARPLLPSGQTRGALFLRPLRIVRAPGEEEVTDVERPLMARAEQVAFSGQPPAIGEGAGLFNCAEDERATARLLLHLSWRTATPLSSNYTASLRLTDVAGLELAQCDVQPGYGYQPSSLWPAGAWVHDLLALPLPERLPPDAPYALVVRLYDEQGQTVLTRRLGDVDWEGETLAFRPTQPTYSLPEDIAAVAASFGGITALRGYRLERKSGSLALTLYWEALAAGQRDYVRFVHLVNPETGQIVERDDGTTVQVDAMPRNGSYPTSQWTAGEIVEDPVTLALEGVAAGTYRLAVGFYPEQDPNTRLPATDPQGQMLPDNAFHLPEMITVDR